MHPGSPLRMCRLKHAEGLGPEKNVTESLPDPVTNA